MFKKISLFTATAMIISAVGINTCSAAIFDGGDGTENNPYVISTQAQLEIVADLPELNYKLANDISLTGSWTTIGSLGNSFSGTLDGNGHKILNASSTLFKTNEGTIKNLTVENEKKVKNSILVTDNKGSIVNCHVSGEMYPGYRTGGIAGENMTSGIINKCSANVFVSDSSSVSNNSEIGGIAGENRGVISECFSSGSIDTYVNGYANSYYNPQYYHSYSGGIVGRQNGGQTENCYSVLTVKARSGQYGTAYAGGIVGCLALGGASVNNSYAFGAVYATEYEGGICGLKDAGTNVTNSYYNKDTTGCSDTGKGIPKSTLGMKLKSIYTDWDFENVWGINDEINDGYPYLKWQYADEPAGDSVSVEIIAADSTDDSLKFISEVKETGNPDIAYFGTTFIPLSLFDDTDAKSVNVIYDNDEYNIQDGQSFGATLTGIPEQCRDWVFVGKSYTRDSNKKYTWSEAKTASVNNTKLNSVN